MTNCEGELKEEHFVVNCWNDEKYESIISQYKDRRCELKEKAEAAGLSGYEPRVDVPPHIRNWFENPIYQTLVKPSGDRIVEQFDLSVTLTCVVFVSGIVLLVIGVALAILSMSKAADSVIVVGVLLSGTASIIAALLKAVAVLQDTASQYAKLQISVSAGMISLDGLQRIVGHQERLSPEELKTIQEITKALAPLVMAFEKTGKED